MTPSWAKAAAGLAATLALVSCASVSVQDVTEHATQGMPTMIYVMPFSTAHADFKVDREGQELADFKANLQLMLKTGMVADLNKRLAPATPGSQADWARQNTNVWIVTGEFTKVNQGSRLLRSTIGFGAGGTKMETKVYVYDMSQDFGKPFMTFATTGGSGAEPGAAVSMTTDPLYIAIGGVSGLAHGLSEDTARTARMVTAQLSDYMYKRGWIPEDKWIKPKTTGSGDVF